MHSFLLTKQLPFLIGAMTWVCLGQLPRASALPTALGRPPISGESGAGSEKPTHPSPPLDIVLERIKIDGQSEETVGEGIVGDDKHQTISLPVIPEQAQNFLAHIKNNGKDAASFRVNLNGPLSVQKTETAWNPTGWSCLATVDGDATDILKSLQSQQGWNTPRLEPGEEAVVRLSMMAKAPSEKMDFAADFRLTARSGDLSDTVVGKLGVQFISRVEWSMDGENWKPVNGTLQVPLLQGIGVRAVRANPNIDWDDFVEFLPTWDYQESWHTKTTHGLGEMIWFESEGAGTINFTANGGNMVSGKIVYPPDTNTENDDD